MAKIKIRKTGRGFAIGEFLDSYGKECSIQKSSAALEDYIWLGIDDPDPEISSRMHLSIEKVKELLPILQQFVETGELS